MTALIKLVQMDALVMEIVLVEFVFVIMNMVVQIVVLSAQDQMENIVVEVEDVLKVFVIVSLDSLDMLAI